jgi:uncharacterized membrane protein YphA (DoxX/SURF4 family)/peroxiredoxin
MGSLLLGSRVLLALVFATAGVAKLLDRAGSRRTLADFGVPRRVVVAAALLLPLAEIGTAVALVAHPYARWGAIGALVLLLAFAGGIARAMMRGRSPDCHCFGQLHSSPAGRGTLVRNAALATPAAFVAWQGPGPALDAWLAERSAAEVALLAGLLVATAVAAFGLGRWLERRHVAVDADDPGVPGLPMGAPAPSLALPAVRGGTVTLDSLRSRGLPVALVFTDPNCGPCGMMYPELARWQAALAGSVTITLVSTGGVPENRPASEEHGIADVLIQKDSETMDAYRVRGTPSAVIVTPEGRIASAPAVGSFAIEQLIRLTLRGGTVGAAARSAAAIGTKSSDQFAY